MVTVSGSPYRPAENSVTGPLALKPQSMAGVPAVSFPTPVPAASGAPVSVQQYGASELAPNSVQFTPPPPDSSVEPGDSRFTRVALELSLERVFPEASQPAVKNALARGLGFKDFETLCQKLARMPVGEQRGLIHALTSASTWQSHGSALRTALAQGNVSVEQAFTSAGQPVLQNLTNQLNARLQKNIQALFLPTAPSGPSFEAAAGQQWSPAALLGIHNSLQMIKNESPADFNRIAQASPAFKFKLEAAAQSPEAPAQIALQDPFARLNDAMKIAHTSCQGCAEHKITVRPGAVYGTADSILDSQILDKLGLFNRGNTDMYTLPDCKDGKNQWYTESELRQRELITGNPPAINRQQALQLLKDLNQEGSAAEQTWRSLISFGNAAGVFDPQALKQNSVLSAYLKPGTAGLDMEKLWNVFYKTKDSAEIGRIQAAVDRGLSKASNQVVANTVFKMEQMKQVQGLQNFLNGIQPDAARDLLRDGTVGPRTQNALKRLEGIMALNALKKNMPQPPSVAQEKAASDILKQLTAQNFNDTTLSQVKTQMKALLQQLPNRSLQENPPKTLHETMSKLIDRIDGVFNQQTTTDLVENWLSVVDSANEGHVLSDLVTHEIGHNLMEIFKRERPELPLDRDWASIAGKADQSEANSFSVTPMTRSFFRNEHEEVSDYGESSPNEDFAEAYRLFMSDPEALLKRAPTKFLALNALSGRWSGAEVQEKFGAGYQGELQQAWSKLMGHQGAQYHLSAQMMDLMHKTYGQHLNVSSDSPLQPQFVSTDTTRQSKSAIPQGKLPLTAQRLNALKTLKSPSQADLSRVDLAMQKWVNHLQRQGGSLSPEQARALLGADYDLLPPAFKNMLDNPHSFVHQYLSNPDAPGRQASSTWVRTEALEQWIRPAEAAHQERQELVGLVDPKTGSRRGGTLNSLLQFKAHPSRMMRSMGSSLDKLQRYFEKLNQFAHPPVVLPDRTQLEQYLKDLMATTTCPEELLRQVQQKVGL